MTRFVVYSINRVTFTMSTKRRDFMTSLKHLAGTTNSYLVLMAIQHAIAGYTRLTAGCMDKIPDTFTVDITADELKPHFARINEVQVSERAAHRRTSERLAASPFTGMIINRARQ